MCAKKKLGGEVLERVVGVIEKEKREKETQPRVAAPPEPIEIAVSCVFAHEKQNDRAPIERREGKKVERTQQEIELEEDPQRGGGKIALARNFVDVKYVVRKADPQRHDSDQHERVVGCGTSERHPAGEFGMATLPCGVERRARPPNHAVIDEEGNDGNHDHAPRFPLDVRHGIERDLIGGGVVPTKFCGKRVRRFVARGGKKKSDEPNKADSEKIRRKAWHEKRL